MTRQFGRTNTSCLPYKRSFAVFAAFLSRVPRFAGTIAVLLMGCLSSVVWSDSPQVDFVEQIKPILSDRCFRCHGPDAQTREADLRLDLKDAVLRATESGAFAEHVVLAGKPSESEVFQRLVTDDPDLKMPPEDSGSTLTDDEISLIRSWIEQGANWTEHWSFQRVAPTAPPTSNSAWPKTPIDQFILARMTDASFQPASRATPEALIRRLHFDLTGLPPTLEEIDTILSSHNFEAAYEARVDALLDSPHFGQRLASDWLDVARYSDTYGYQVDRDRYVWPWRDWVIRAFNRNMPYDQFITEQLAGDLLENRTSEQILATTFNRLHPQKVEGGSTPEEFRIEYVADRTQTFATAFLGLTLECARCHDHKYDPLSQKEYYQFSAFFDQIDEAGLYSYFTPSIPTPTLALYDDSTQEQLRSAQARVNQEVTALQRVVDSRNASFQAWLNQAKRTLAPKPTAPESGTDSERDSKEKSTDEKPSDKPGKAEDTSKKAPPPEASPHPVIPGRIWLSDFEAKSYGANKLVEGRNGKAIELSGDDRCELGVGNFTRHQPFTISLWLWTPDHKERSVVFHRSRAWTDAASRGYELLIEDGELSAALIHFWPGNAIRIRTTDKLPVQRWAHVTIAYDGSSSAPGLKIFVDGKPSDTYVVRDKLVKNITGGGFDNLMIGERFRDRGFTRGRVDDFQVFDRQLSPLEIQQLHDGRSLTDLLEKTTAEMTADELADLYATYLFATDDAHRSQREKLRAAREAVGAIEDKVDEIMVMSERDGQRKTFVLNRGAYDQRRDEVHPTTPDSLNPFPSQLPRNRLGLASWLTSPDNPLTARVAVNRYWQLMFGEALVRTPEDFGSQGKPPTHPQLMDWLANDFMANGWNVKRLIKQFVMSSTYQQSAHVTEDILRRDPENLYWTRSMATRLPAEMLRDNALFVSGLLVDKIGGPPAKPYELEVSFKPAKPDAGDGVYRRSLYTYWKRTGPAPVMMALDAAKRDVCRVKRERTSSPLQALVIMNGPQFVEAARGLALRLTQKHGDNDQAILTDTFRWLTGRTPTKTQVNIIQTLFEQQHTYFAEHPDEQKKYLSVGRLKIDQESANLTKLAAFAAVANSLMNYDGALARP